MKYLLILLIFISACQSLPDNQAEKFNLINQALEKGVVDARETSFLAESSFRKQVHREGNTPEGKNRIAQWQTLNKQVALVIQKIEDAKNQIKGKTPQEAEKLMLGENKNGLAYGLKTALDQYRRFLILNFKNAVLTTDYLYPLAEGNESNPIFRSYGSETKLDFGDANFKNSSVESMLAILTYKQWKVIDYQQQILIKNHREVFLKENNFSNEWLVWVKPKSRVIKQGEIYEAEMSAIKISQAVDNPSLAINGLPQTLSRQNLSFLEIPIEKSGNQALKIEYRYKHPKQNEDTSLVFAYPYYVFPISKTN